VVGQWDRLRDDQRHRGTRDRRQGRYRVRNKFEYTDWYGSDEGSDYDNQEFSNDGRVTIHYVRPQKTKFRDSLRYEDNHVLERRRSHSSKYEKEALELTDTCHVQQPYQRQRKTLPHQESTHSEKVNQDVVSFYFTNIPHDISYVALRQGFEVCGIMEDVYLARKRNVNGGAFGFVRYGNDNNVDFSYQPSIGASGGMITLWNRNEVEVWLSFNMEHVLGVQGRFLKICEKFTLLNVYAKHFCSVGDSVG